MEGLSRKLYLKLPAPTEADSRSSEARILSALRELGYEARMTLKVMRKLYPLCEKAGWQLTASLAWDGSCWVLVELEAGDTTREHYGLAVDLGSTTVVARLFDCNTGKCLAEDSAYNRQIAFGTDILTRIFYSKDQPEKLEELRRAAVGSIREVLEKLEKKTGIAPGGSIQLVLAGNTTMVHFFLGLDAFCVFQTPYAVQADRPGFLPAAELELPVSGYVYCYPGKSNYLGGDIISGMVATELYKKEGISVFFDIGTNGELVVGNREFLLCGAGAAGPALEGGVVDIRKIKIASLRKHFGQMLQDVFLFSGTIRSNILLREEGISDERIQEVCRYVNADHFINRLENGLDEEVRERGNNFSAGQRQLLSFARTIIHEPEVIILDEATANIDTETELLIQDSLEKMRNIGTMLIVAHRLSTIQHADNIIVLSKGKILEQGNHQELLAAHGSYYQLYTLQYHKDLLTK